MDSRNMMSKSERVRKATPKRLGMEWRQTKNLYDYGIFTMRHMETYQGQGLQGWNIGLKETDTKLVGMLRVKYISAILVNENNEYMQSNLVKARNFAKKAKEEKQMLADRKKGATAN
ncbi:unnamed protein product [Cuscuta europaea]|uniref:Uncharacterized protein n=1 Tax=Cuscuta europaea TaxID=41803 RepID=A0A9P1E7P7_CUSEU|nr:unnamed protein product [Cuscuta europaea]